jgi:CheY-like chemotaxis protein
VERLRTSWPHPAVIRLAHTVSEALAILKASTPFPDIILADLTLPWGDGSTRVSSGTMTLDVLLATLPLSDQRPAVVVISGDALIEEADVRKHGADALVTKGPPLLWERLQDRMRLAWDRACVYWRDPEAFRAD